MLWGYSKTVGNGHKKFHRARSAKAAERPANSECPNVERDVECISGATLGIGRRGMRPRTTVSSRHSLQPQVHDLSDREGDNEG